MGYNYNYEGNEMAKILKKTGKYQGKYVAMKSINDTIIVGSGKDHKIALRQASAKGIKGPVLVYVPKKGLPHIYAYAEALAKEKGFSKFTEEDIERIIHKSRGVG